MCRQCLPIIKNKEQQMNDKTKSRSKETVSDEHEQILKKT